MPVTEDMKTPSIPRQRVVLVTGPAGAGRTTAINALEDLGYEAIDNLPLGLLPRLLSGPPPRRPLALGIDARNRDFSVAAMLELADWLAGLDGVAGDLLYLDCRPEVLLRRYSETRRRHPLAPAETPQDGIAREIDLLAPVCARADILIDSSELTPHELRAEIRHWCAPENGGTLAVSVQSFSYKRGLPPGADLLFDCRFLVNPHWQPELRHRDGTDPEVAAHVRADARYAAFFGRLWDLLGLLLPAYGEEGKAHVTVAFGCTGGRHRSVAAAEDMAAALAEAGWPVSIRHRELERQDDPAAGPAPEGAPAA